MWLNNIAIFWIMKHSILVFVSLIITISQITTANAVNQSEALLKFKSSILHYNALDSWKQGTNACDSNTRWYGVVCYRGAIYGLQLEQKNLSGPIDIDALVQIPEMRSISLMSNSFNGSIPEFNRLGALKALYLSDNQFSGGIPKNFFGEMRSLKKLWLSRNNFSGEIPSSLAEVPPIIELRLEKNQFSGKIPSWKESSIVSLDLSDNNLEGEIPESLSKFNASSFQGNPGLCGGKLGNTCEDTSKTETKEPKESNETKEPKDSHHDRTKMISLWILLGCAVLFILMVVGIFLLRRRQRNRNESDDNVDEEHLPVGRKTEGDLRGASKGSSRRGSKGVPDLVIINDEKGNFGLPDLMKSAAEVLGTATLGSSYKAVMSDGLTVVVKRIKDMNKLGKDAFDAEVRCFGRLKHPNVLPALAYHYRKEEKLIIHDYMPQGSLLFLLHGDRGSPNVELKWPIRLKIIQGIARGLGFLHTELTHLEIPHGNLKSSNVLLTPEYEPLLIDYGFSALANTVQATQALIAYKSPEAMKHQQVSPKCDVYCLGVIILEILTGKFPITSGKGGIDVVQWVQSAIAEGKEGELFDSDIASSENGQTEMMKMLHIGAACTNANPDHRLDIREAIRRIEGDSEVRKLQELPTLRDGYAESPVVQSLFEVQDR